MKKNTYCSPDCDLMVTVLANPICETSDTAVTESFDSLVDFEW